MPRLLDNESAETVTGEWISLPVGVWKFALEQDSTSSSSVALEQRVDGGDPIKIDTIVQGYATHHIAEGDEVRAIRETGSGVVTVHASPMTRI